MIKTRTQNVIKNMWIGTSFQIISLILGFVSRTLFIKILAEEYLGLNSLFTNVLTILSFAELGIGNAIIFSMYKPLAENDMEKLKKLTNFYKSTYLKIGLIMILVGVFLIPFLSYIIGDTPDIVENIYIIYLLFLMDTSISYFFSYRTSIIIADQKNYIIVLYTYVFRIIQIVLQLTLLYFTHKYLLYLFLQVLNTLITQLFLSIKSKKMYPELAKLDKSKKLEKKEKDHIFVNVKALFSYKLASVILNGTDSIIITKCLGLGPLGLYSNYYLLMNSLTLIISQILNAFTASVGNLLAKESVDKEKKIFNQLFYFTGMIYCIVGICLYLLFNDFIVIWLGEDFLLSKTVVAAIVGHMVINGMQFSTFTYRNTSGEFNHFKYVPLYAAVLNIGLSIWWAKSMGLAGIFLATIVSRLLSAGWTDPYIVYKYVFNMPIWDYIKRYGTFIIRTALTFMICFIISKNIDTTNLLMFLVKACVLGITSLGMYILLTFRTQEFIGIKNALLFTFRKKER